MSTYNIFISHVWKYSEHYNKIEYNIKIAIRSAKGIVFTPEGKYTALDLFIPL